MTDVQSGNLTGALGSAPATSAGTIPDLWLTETSKTVEGHTNSCILYFNGNKHWETSSCHDNTVDIANALHRADPRLRLELKRKSKTVEGHTRRLNLKVGNDYLLRDHSVHNNMEGMVNTINTIWKISPPGS